MTGAFPSSFCLIVLAVTPGKVGSSSESRHPCNIRKALQSFTTVMMLAVGVHKCLLSCWGNSSTPDVLSVFIKKRCWISPVPFLHRMRWSCGFSLLHSMNMMHYFD